MGVIRATSQSRISAAFGSDATARCTIPQGESEREQSAPPACLRIQLQPDRTRTPSQSKRARPDDSFLLANAAVTSSVMVRDIERGGSSSSSKKPTSITSARIFGRRSDARPLLGSRRRGRGARVLASVSLFLCGKAFTLRPLVERDHDAGEVAQHARDACTDGCARMFGRERVRVE